jgi:hypothetical protein
MKRRVELPQNQRRQHMAELKSKSSAKPVPFESDGLMAGWVSQSAELAERSLSTSFQAAREVGTEVHQRFGAGVDLVDSSAQAVAKLVRGMSGHVLEMFEAVLEAGENVSLGFVHTARGLAHDVTGLASRASSSLVHAREERSPRAAA